MEQNPWYGHSRGHRMAALMRWGKISRGKVSRRRRVRRSVTRRHAVVGHRRARYIDRRTKAYKAMRAAQYREAAGFLALTGPGKKARFRYKAGEGWVRRRKHNIYGGIMRRRRNTWFGQPRRHRKAAKKGWRSGHMVPFHYTKSSRRRLVRHANPMSYANPRRRRYHHGRRRHNPALTAHLGKFTSGVMDIRSWGPLAITGGLSAVTGAVVPGMLGVVNPWMKYGVQTAVAVGGGIVVENLVDKRHGQAWMIVGVSMVGYQLLKELVLQPYFPQFAVGLGDYQSYYPNSRYEEADEVSQHVGAFPQAMSAFPQAMSEYPGVGAYPYDGSPY